MKQDKSGLTLSDFMCSARNTAGWFYWFGLLWYKSCSGLFQPVTLKDSTCHEDCGLFCFFLEPIYKTSCALTSHAIGRYSPDVLKNHAKEVLPLAFLGMHEIADEEKAEKEECNLWTEVWQENVPG